MQSTIENRGFMGIGFSSQSYSLYCSPPDRIYLQHAGPVLQCQMVNLIIRRASGKPAHARAESRLRLNALLAVAHTPPPPATSHPPTPPPRCAASLWPDPEPDPVSHACAYATRCEAQRNALEQLPRGAKGRLRSVCRPSRSSRGSRSGFRALHPAMRRPLSQRA